MAEIVFRFPVVVRQNSIAALPVDSVTECATGDRMLTALVVLLRSIGLMRRRHRAVALENLARHQQLAALTRTVTRPQLRTSDRLFWVLLAKGWRERKWHGGCLVRIVTVKGKEKGSEDTFNVVKDTLVADSVIRLVERA